jgi:hypothetical protein
MSVTGLRNASAPSPNRAASTGTYRTGPMLRAMITPQGYGLIAELIAAALLITALTGLFVQRSKPWLVGVTMAFVILTAAATVVIASST